MNYYKQFAEMLGLELEQEFHITSDDGERTSPLLYKIRQCGIFSRVAKDADGFWGLEQSQVIASLLIGELKAVPKPWKPKYGEHYWYCSETIEPVAIETIWSGISGDLCKWKCGNCFKTREEAQSKGKEIMEQIQKEYEEA